MIQLIAECISMRAIISDLMIICHIIPKIYSRHLKSIQVSFLYYDFQKSFHWSIDLISCNSTPRMMFWLCMSLNSLPFIRLIFRRGFLTSCSSSVGSRSSSGNAWAYLSVKHRTSYVFVNAIDAASDTESEEFVRKCARSSDENRSPTPEK